MDEIDEDDMNFLKNAKKSIRIQSGSILEAKEQFILIDNCCVTSQNFKYTGLKKKIFDQFPYANVHENSQKDVVHMPGSISVKGDGKDQRFIVNLFSQYKESHPSLTKFDSYNHRIGWFSEALSKVYTMKKLRSIAIPNKIGCFKHSQGEWSDYFEIINLIAAARPRVKTVLYTSNIRNMLNNFIYQKQQPAKILKMEDFRLKK